MQKVPRAIPLKESAVRINFAQKRQPNQRSKKSLDGLYDVLAPSSVVQKTDNYTSVVPEPGKLDVTVRNSDIAKFRTRDESKARLHEHINKGGLRILEMSRG